MPRLGCCIQSETFVEGEVLRAKITRVGADLATRAAPPSTHTTDLHHVGHHEVRGLSINGMLHVQRAAPVLAALDRCPGSAIEQ